MFLCFNLKKHIILYETHHHKNKHFWNNNELINNSSLHSELSFNENIYEYNFTH